MENYARFLAQGLAEVGCEVVVVCGDRQVRRPTRDEVDGHAVWRLPVWRVVSNTPVNLAWSRQLRQIIRAERPDVINAHTPVPFMVDVVTRAAGSLPVVVTYHAATLFKPGSAIMTALTTGYLVVQRFTLSRARFIIAVSPYVRECMSRWQSKTVVVANAVTDVAAAREVAGTGLAFVGNLEPSHTWKGLDLLLDALAILKRDGLAVGLTVVGDGTDRPRYEQRAQALDLREQVRFVGRLVGSDRDALVRQAAAVVLYPTTANDAFPTVMLEAWAQGAAVIAAAMGPLPSLVADGETGILVEPANPTALARALRDGLIDQSRLLALGEAGRQLVSREYTWPLQVERTRAVLKAAVDGTAVAPLPRIRDLGSTGLAASASPARSAGGVGSAGGGVARRVGTSRRRAMVNGSADARPGRQGQGPG
jgi:glycosyltransferase involved in cell wall biosynthesis